MVDEFKECCGEERLSFGERRWWGDYSEEGLKGEAELTGRKVLRKDLLKHERDGLGFGE